MNTLNVMSAIPHVNIALQSPKRRPAPKFFIDSQTFSTKKEREGTPRANQYPRPPIKSCPPISRVFQHCPSTSSRPRIVSFRESSSNSLSPLFDEGKKELYFQQCFIIEKKLGAGSFGDVYKVRSKEDGKHYAVKRSKERFKGDIDRQRKLEEVSKHELLPEHPNCVKFYRAWEERQHLYIQTELCETSLADLTEQEHEIPEKLVWSYLVDLLMAVKHLHDHDLIHMDIKPENIFIAKDGTCQLGDFGLILDLSKNLDLSEAQEGDPKYLAPELMQGKFTKAADIFSLGITILELACDLDLPRGNMGWHQLRSGTFPETITKDRVSPELLDVIMLMMEPDPVQRPTAESLLSLVVIKKVQRYNSLRKQKEVMEAKLLNLWHYILHLLTLFWGLFTPTEVDLPVGEDADLSRSSASDVVINSSWDSDEDVFMDSSISRTLDFSSESNESEEFTLPFRPPPPKCLTTGARRQPVRTARIMGGVESPVKTPSQGSPILLPSSRSSRSSTAAAAAAPNPSSTTPPSCRKKMIFDNEDNYLPIGPKNLMAVFDAADSDNEGL